MACRDEVSVIIPVHNCERYLAEAVESIFSQDYHPIEVIVVDDGSTDGSAEIAKRFVPSVRYISQEHCGAPIARNRGVELAEGEFLAFLDADDRWVKDKLEMQMDVFERNPGMDMVFGHVRQFHSPDTSLELKAKLTYIAEVMPGYHSGTMLIKRESFNQVGPLLSTLSAGDFIDWYLRATDKGLRSHMLPEVVMERRLHAGNFGVLRRDLRSEYVQVAKAALDRRRSKNPNAEK